MEQPDMQLDDEQIGAFKTAQDLLRPPEIKDLERQELERQQIIAFHEERLNWRLQRAFEEGFPGRAFQQPRPARPRPVAVKPQGFA
jgi:hypothetical protein